MIKELLYSLVVFASSTYTDVNSVEASRVLKEVLSKPYHKLQSDADQVEWVKARLALIALERLKGNEPLALEYFMKCEEFCSKHAPDNEWRGILAWGCQKKREAKSCLSYNTKAQKPPR